MKALTLTQPWASLVAIGAKRIETRSWSTSYRGPLAIHAAKGFPKSAQEFTQVPPVSVLFGRHYEYPRGVVLATCRLVNCVPTQTLLREAACERCDGKGTVDSWQDGMPGQEYCPTCDGNRVVFVPGGKLSTQEQQFGDYGEGRYAWMLDDIQPVPFIPAKGALGLWEWTQDPPARATQADGNGGVFFSKHPTRRRMGKPTENRKHRIGIRVQEQDRERILQLNICQDTKWSGRYQPLTVETRALVMADRIEHHATAARWSGSAGIQKNLELVG